MLKKILSFFMLIMLNVGLFPIGINNTFANTGDQTLTAPTPTFVENQVQPITSFKMNRYLLGYNVDLGAKTYIKQIMNLDRDTLGGISFRMSRVQELRSTETAEKIKLSMIQKDDTGNDVVLATVVKDGVSSMSKTEVKWLFPEGLAITAKKDLALKIEVENPNTDVDGSNFAYYVYGKEDFDSKPLYFGNMLFFDGNQENTTSDILSLTILRADNNNLGVPIPSDYQYPEVESIHSYLLNASNFKVISDFGGIDTSNVSDKCNEVDEDGMTYRPLTNEEFENLLRHSKYFNTLMDKVNESGLPITNYIYVTPTSYYKFDGMDKDQIKANRYYTDISNSAGSGEDFAFCVYDETANKEGDTKKVTTDNEQEIALTGLDYNVGLNLTNKTPNQTIVSLDAQTAIFNSITKEIKGNPYDTGIDIQGGNLMKVFGRIAINNSGFHDGNGYRDVNTNIRQGQLAYKIGNSEWKTGDNIIDVNSNGRLYLAIVDNDNNLANNLGEFKIVIEKIIVTNSIRKDNNLYFNINKNINQFNVKIGETTTGTDFNEIYQSTLIDAPKIKVKGLSFTYEEQLDDLVGTVGLAFDGSYYYTIKGDKLLKIGSGYNETINGEITEYTINKNLSNIVSLVSINGDLYVGYNDKGLSNYIGRFKFNGAGTVEIENIKLSDSLISLDLGDIKNKKLEKTRYLLTADNRYIYNISYLAGNETEANDSNKDKGYEIKIFDPKNEMALIKNIFVNPILDSDGNVKEKIGYYTEGAFVDRNYIYIIETNSTTLESNVVIIDKVTFEVQGKTTLKQYNNASDCSAASDSTSVYSCAKNGVFDLINNKLILLSGNVGKLHYYNIDTDNLVHFRVPLYVDLDEVNQDKEFLIRYGYKYNKVLTPESYISETKGEKISNDTKYVDRGYQLSNSKITLKVADVVRETADDRLYKEYSGGITKLTRNEGNSSSIRGDDRGINYSYLKVNDIIHKWRGDYGTVSRIKDKGFEIKGERDDKLIVPSLRYELDENNEFVKLTISIRNDSSVTLYENNVEYGINLGGDYTYIDNRGVEGTSIGDYADKYVVADDTGTDDSLVFAIKDSSNQRIGIGGGVLHDVKLLIKRIQLNPGEERSFDFYIGSKTDSEDNDLFYDKIMNSSDLITDYSITDNDNINNKLLNTSISKSERIIQSPVIGVDSDYLYESDNVNIVVPFEETWDEDRVDADGKPLSGNGWWSDGWVRDSSTNVLKTTIENAAGDGKIASLELVKYIPNDTTLTFDIAGTTDGSSDRFAFFIDDDEKFSLGGDVTSSKTFTLAKGLHILTWKYGKDQKTGNQNDVVTIDNIVINETLEVFGDNCAYSGSSLFYTTAYYNNFNQIETSNGDAYTYRTTICQDELEARHKTDSDPNGEYSNPIKRNGNIVGYGRKGPPDCNEEDVGQGTHNGITSSTTLADTSGGHWDRARTRAYGWYIAKYGNGQVATANQFIDDGYHDTNDSLCSSSSRQNCLNVHPETLKFDITHPNGQGEMKIYFDTIYGPKDSPDDLGKIYFDGDYLGKGGTDSQYITDVWRTKIISDSFSSNETKPLLFTYDEVDGGDDGATYFDNMIIKVEDPKSGCHMEPLAYNDKLGTHFILHGYNMQTSDDRTKDVKGVAHILPIEGDTFVEIQKINPTDGSPIGDKKFLYNQKIGEKISFNVEEGYNYDIVANKNISILMDNFYPDLSRTGDTTQDDTPTYDTQNGDKFVVMIPGNKYKKGNLYVAHYELDRNTHVKVTDLTNNKTNFEFDLIGENESKKPIPLAISQLAVAGNNTISSRMGNTFFIDENGKVYGVGYNSAGQLGDGTTTHTTTSVSVDTSAWGDAKIVSVNSGLYSTVFLDENGKAYGVGKNSNGQLGDGTTTNTSIPVSVDTSAWGKNKIISIVKGNYSTMFIDENGKVYGVGKNSYGQLGDGTTSDKSIPVAVDTSAWGDAKIVSVSSNGYHTMFIDENGKVYGVGYNYKGALGDGTTTNTSIPVSVDTSAWGDAKIVSVSTGGYFSTFLDENGKVYSVGYNNSGQLGNGTNDDTLIPVAMDTSAWGDAKIVSVSSNGYQVLLLDENGKAYGVGNNSDGQLGDGTTTSANIPVEVDTSAWGNSKIVAISMGNYYKHSTFLDENGKVYSVGDNSKGQLGDGTNDDKLTPVEVDSSTWNPAVIGTPIAATGIYPTNLGETFELTKPYRSFPGIGEGQILKIESDHPITIYYGLGTKPAMSELISPNSQDFYYPVLADPDNYVDYNTQMYTYYDLNLAKIQDFEAHTLISGTINIGDDISAGIPSADLIGKWNKGIATGPVGLAVGNKSSSYNYLYPIKSSKKLFGIGNQYLFNNVNANKLILISDYNDNNSVDVTIKKDGNVVDTVTMLPKTEYIVNIDSNAFYSIETDDIDKHIYLYAEKGDNVRNTFSTIFKSRENKQLGNKIIKNDIGDKYLKYDIMGDFDFIIDEPIETGEININSSMYDTSNLNDPVGPLTNVSIGSKEKMVVNGIWSYDDSTPHDLNIETLEKGRYINGIKYKTLQNTDYDRGLFYEKDGETDVHYVGGGLINQSDDASTYQLGVKDDDFSNNGPNAIYKKYSASTYFPEISRTPLYDFIKATGNKLDISLDGTEYFGKRNLSNKGFDLDYNNGVISVETTANSHEFTDTYYIPVIREIDEDTLDYVELNKISTLGFTMEGDTYGTICATVEDNNRVIKNICYNNDLTEGELRTDLLNVGRVKHLDSGVTDHVRNLYSDYVQIFNDGTKPMKLLGLELTGVKKTDFTTTFSNVFIENYTDVTPELFFKPNKNIFSEDTPLSHSLKIGTLDIQRGAPLLKPFSDTLDVTLPDSNEEVIDDRFSFTQNGLDYNMVHIKDLDLLNEDMEESQYTPSRLYPLEEKHDYTLFFRAKGFGLKQIKLINEDNTHTYIDSLFTPRQYTGNMQVINGENKDLGDLYSLNFKTNWDDNEKVKVQMINHNGDLWVSDIFILRLDDSDFATTEDVLQADGTTITEPLPNTGKLPTMLAKNKKGNVKGETIYKNVSYYKYSDNTWIGDIDNKEALEQKFIDLDSETDIEKIYTYLDDKNVLNFVDGDKFDGVTMEKMTTNLFSEQNQTLKIRFGLVGTIKLNGNYLYSNLNDEQFGCIEGTGNYTDYTTNNIKEDNCLLRLPLRAGNNVLEISSVVNNADNIIKGVYKDKSLNLVSIGDGNTTNELLTYNVSPGMPVSVQSLNPFNTVLNNALDVEGQSATIGLMTKELNVLSVQNIDRDYALKEIPTILNTTTNRNTDITDVDRLIEFGRDKKLNITSGTTEGDYVKSPGYNVNGKVEIKTTTGSDPIGLNSSDILELFVRFPNKPTQFNIELDNGTKQQNMFWGDNYIFTEEVDGINIIREGDIESLDEDTWYKVYIPAKGTILENSNLVNLNFTAFGGDMNISEITVLKNKLDKEGNNVRVTFDVDILDDTQKRDIIFGLTNNSTFLEKQGYEVNFSKNGSTTELLKNGVVIGSVTNDDSYIKDGVESYKIMFVKNQDHLYVSVKYDYTDPADGIYKTKVDHLLNVIDTNPLNLKNSQLVFKNNKNKYKVYGITVEDGEDNEKMSFVKFSAINQNYSNGTITVYNDKGDVDTLDFQLYDNLEDIYTSIATLSSYNSVLTDIVIKPNKSTVSDNTYNIKEISLIKGSETPAVISGNSTMNLLGVTRVNKGSKVSELFTNNKEYIMGFTLFVSKPSLLSQPEGLTLRLYEADASGNPKVDGNGDKIILTEKTVNTDGVDISPNITPLKIVFPQIAVVDGQDYIFELSTNNKDGLYIYGTNKNTFTGGYAYVDKVEKSFIESFEFNTFGDREYGERKSIGYLGSSLGGTDVPDREIVSGSNLKVVAKKDKSSTITITESDNIELQHQATFLFKGNFTPSNGTSDPLILEKELQSSPYTRSFGFYIDKTSTNGLHYSIQALDGTMIADGVTNFGITGSDTIIAVTIDTVDGKMNFYKDGNLEETINLDPNIIGTPFVNLINNPDAKMVFFGNHDGWTGDQELDYFRIYDKVLSNAEIIKESKPITEYKYRLPYDIAYFMISKSNEVETVEERTYDLGDGIIYEVEGDLILDGYDAGDGIKRLILKGNSTFRVKGNIFINADEVLVINDNTLQGDEALSYIGFITDNDIIIGKNVSYIQGGYFAKGSIKTELSNIQLKVNGLLAGDEIDLQNRTFLQQGKICSADEKENCSVVLEYDKRIYKRIPPLFYENNNKDGIKIVEE